MISAGKDTFLFDFLVFIRDHMLTVDSQTRAEGRAVHNFLKGAYERCKVDVELWFYERIPPDVPKDQNLVDFEWPASPGTSTGSEAGSLISTIEVLGLVDDGLAKSVAQGIQMP